MSKYDDLSISQNVYGKHSENEINKILPKTMEYKRQVYFHIVASSPIDAMVYPYSCFIAHIDAMVRP